VAKYDEQFKLKVVRQYLSGTAGWKRVAKEHGLSHAMVRRWVASYREHGLAGLTKKYKVYSAQFKLALLRRMWRDALSYNQVAALYDIRHPGRVGIWERQYHAGGLDALAPKPRGRPKKMPTDKHPTKPAVPEGQDTRTVEELRKENEYLRAEVAYIKKLDALIQAKKAAARKKRK
jgi:transposase